MRFIIRLLSVLAIVLSMFFIVPSSAVAVVENPVVLAGEGHAPELPPPRDDRTDTNSLAHLDLQATISHATVAT